ncbi:MAG: hypothetical protein BGP06_17360 [Rhizobiales bacterium 65-9]|nr:SDR family oxidoreductase [Hyphomicrobiales bacterium]OJY40202.1 MAG: hypothetical protein BGP06_17360 [Rhizobiales bacterium 65-9]
MTKPVAVVTGAARGIGEAIVAKLAQSGFAVLALDRDPAANKEATARHRATGLDVLARSADVRDRSEIAAALAEFSDIAVAVNNAGIFRPLDFFDLTEEDFRAMIDVNVIGSFILAQEVAKRMRPGGRIINIASRAVLGSPGYAHYVASKAAIVGLTRAMALELHSRGVRVNAVAPGFTDTPMTQSALSADGQSAARAAQPGGVALLPKQIASAVAFLADSGSDAINGQVIFADGGKSIGALPW